MRPPLYLANCARKWTRLLNFERRVGSALGMPKINFARPGTVFFKYLWECNAFLKSFALFRRRIVLYVRNFQKYVIKSLVRSLDFNLPVFHVKRCQKYRLLFVGKDIQSDRIFFGSTLEQIRLTGFQHPF